MNPTSGVWWPAKRRSRRDVDRARARDAPAGTRTVVYADERRVTKVTIEIGNLATWTEAIVGPTGSEVLIGQLVLEALDLIADCRRRYFRLPVRWSGACAVSAPPTATRCSVAASTCPSTPESAAAAYGPATSAATPATHGTPPCPKIPAAPSRCSTTCRHATTPVCGGSHAVGQRPRIGHAPGLIAPTFTLAPSGHPRAGERPMPLPLVDLLNPDRDLTPQGPSR